MSFVDGGGGGVCFDRHRRCRRLYVGLSIFSAVGRHRPSVMGVAVCLWCVRIVGVVPFGGRSFVR